MGNAGLWDFAKALGAQWPRSMTGPLSLIFALLGLWISNEARVLFFVLAVVCFIDASCVVWKVERVRADKLEAESSQRGRLDILFDEDERKYNEYTARLRLDNRVFSVCVRNVGKGRLTSCQLYFDGISTNDGNLPKRVQLCLEPFALNHSEEKFVPIVSFEERASTTAGTLHVPFREDREAGYRTFDASEEHRLTLRAVAAECDAQVRDFRFWVGPDRKLHMVRVDET